MADEQEIMDKLKGLGFSEQQMDEIREGLEHGVDVSKYADPRFDEWQMEQIRYGLERGLDVSKYADPKLDWTQMDEIHRKLEGKPVAWNVIDLTKFDEYQLAEIGLGLVHGIDVSRYASPEYDDDEMREIRLSLEARTEGWEMWAEFVTGAGVGVDGI